MKYDVFISYSRKDYVDENENVLSDSPVKAILDFLDEKEITYWVDKKGLYKGTGFVAVISDAIAESKMMLFLSSVNSNESIYTAGEIHEAINCNKLIIPVRIDESEYNKKFRILVNPLDYIDYSKADAFADLLKAIEHEKEKIAKVQEKETARREELKTREWRKAVEEEVEEQVAEFNKLRETRKALLQSIIKKYDIKNKKCPVCGSETEVEVEYCKTCGWFFPALSEVEFNGLNVEVDKSALKLARSIWDSKKKTSEENTSRSTIGQTNYDILLREYTKNQSFMKAWKTANLRLLSDLLNGIIWIVVFILIFGSFVGVIFFFSTLES